MKKLWVLLLLLLLFSLAACGGKGEDESGNSGMPPREEGSDVNDYMAGGQKTPETNLKMTIGDAAVTVEWEDNDSVAALAELAKGGPIIVQMSMYGDFEQVGPLGTDIPREDVQTTTGPGDVVLYSGDKLVVFYGSNDWAYTRLGHITDKTEAALAELLGNGDVTISLSTE